MATKSLDSAQARRAQEILKRLLAASYGGNQSAMADALKVKQPTLWAVLNGRKGAGGRVLSALYAAHPAAHAEVMGEPSGAGAMSNPDYLTSSVVRSGEIFDTKSLSDEAIDILVDEGMDPLEASRRMHGVKLDKPTVRGFVKAARLNGFARTTESELKPLSEQPKRRARR